MISEAINNRLDHSGLSIVYLFSDSPIFYSVYNPMTAEVQQTMMSEPKVSGMTFDSVRGAAAVAVLYLGGAFMPVQAQPLIDCSGEQAVKKPGEPVRVMTYNIQFLAGGVYELWKGRDSLKPLDSQMQRKIMQEIVNLIKKESPDILLLQEVDIDDRENMNQVQWIINGLGSHFGCRVHSEYTRLNGNVGNNVRKEPGGLQLLTLSRFPILSSVRHELPQMPDQSHAPLTFHRAVLESHIDLGNEKLVVLNTHLDAFAQGFDTMQQQVRVINDLLASFNSKAQKWVLGGDFNLLPQGQYPTLRKEEQYWYQPQSELSALTEKYSVVPTVEQATGEDRRDWFTNVTCPEYGLDRTLDYLFYSEGLTSVNSRVIQQSAENLSDHRPVVAEFDFVNKLTAQQP